jgi:hypothetical protein
MPSHLPYTSASPNLRMLSGKRFATDLAGSALTGRCFIADPQRRQRASLGHPAMERVPDPVTRDQ